MQPLHKQRIQLIDDAHLICHKNKAPSFECDTPIKSAFTRKDVTPRLLYLVEANAFSYIKTVLTESQYDKRRPHTYNGQFFTSTGSQCQHSHPINVDATSLG
jgi:hypothetical protein